MGKTPLPWAKDGPRAEIAKEVLPNFKKHRREVLARAEDQILSNILDPDQADQVLGLLIAKSGPRSMLESAVLQRRMSLSKEQIRDLEEVYFAPQDRWKEVMHEGDKFQHLDGAQELSEFGYKYTKLREKIIDDRIWKIAEQIERAQAGMEEQAMRLIKPEQKLVYDDLLSKKPKASTTKD